MEIQRWIEPASLEKQVYIGNLPCEATVGELVQALSEVGAVKSITIYRRGKIKDVRAFAFVEMGTAEEAKRVIHEYDEGEMHGQILRLSPARGSRENEE